MGSEVLNEDTKLSLRFHNAWAIAVSLIFTAITITITYMGLINRIDLLTQRVELMISNQEVLITKYEGVQTRLGKVELDVKELQTRLFLR